MSEIPPQPGRQARCLNARDCRCLIQSQCLGGNSLTDAHDEHGFALHRISISAAEIDINISTAFFNQLRRPVRKRSGQFSACVVGQHRQRSGSQLPDLLGQNHQRKWVRISGIKCQNHKPPHSSKLLSKHGLLSRPGYIKPSSAARTAFFRAGCIPLTISPLVNTPVSSKAG